LGNPKSRLRNPKLGTSRLRFGIRISDFGFRISELPMSTTEGSSPSPTGRRLTRAAQILVISSVTFTFISYWRTAAVVLCDLASTAYYIGGIVEQSFVRLVPWFLLCVVLISYPVRCVYV